MSFFDWVSESIVDNSERRGPVQVGWLLTDKKGGVLYDDPERIRSVDMSRDHAKSASRCPAILNLETRYFMIKCPFNMQLGFERDQNGVPRLKNKLGDKSPVRGNKLGQMVSLVSEKEWRYKDRPTVQIMTPYVFIADEPVYMSQVAPFMHYLPEPWPGTIFGGRFPIHVWPRPLMWAFEWHDTSKDLILKRGDPWFYVGVETLPADRAVVLTEAEETEELKDYLEMISGAVNYVNQTFSLFKAAEKRRPQTLLKPRDRKK